MEHDALREMRDGSLRVRYNDELREGWFSYERCPFGGLGFETELKTSEQKLPVFYSEKPDDKTLFSSLNESEKPLPDKVTEWLITGKSLYQLVRIDTSNTGDETQVTEPEGCNHILWDDGNGQMKCCREHAGCAIIFTAGVVYNMLEEVTYQGQTCVTMMARVIK